MKLKFFESILFFFILGLSYINIQAQQPDLDCPVCPRYLPLDKLICNDEVFTKWNWEIPCTDPSYCSVWAIRMSEGGVKFIGAPWDQNSSDNTGFVDKVKYDKDYTKEKGWELLLRDFGCADPVNAPVFILYNKYSGIMRIFAYMPNPNTSYSYVGFRIKHSMNYKNSAFLAHSRSISLAADKYLQNKDDGEGEEFIVMNGEDGGAVDQWVAADFMPTFDPNASHDSYKNSAIDISFRGYKVADFKMQGEGITNRFTVSGNSTSLSPDSDGKISVDKIEKGFDFVGDIDGYRTKLNKKGQELSKGNNEFLKGVGNTLADATSNSNTFSKVMSTVSGLASAAGPIIGAIGSFIGIFSKTTPPFVPTITRFNFTGTITLVEKIRDIGLKLPGNKQTEKSNAQFYDSPLGLINLNNTPKLNQMFWNDLAGTSYNVYKNLKPSGSSCELTVDDFRYVSYALTNDLSVTYNSTSPGLEVLAVQVALVIKPNLRKDKNKAYYDPTLPDHQFPYRDLKNKRLILNPNYDLITKQSEFQTPFVDLNCAKGLSINARSGVNFPLLTPIPFPPFEDSLHSIYVRVKAILRNPNLDDGNTPIIFVQDYMPDIIPIPNQSSPIFYNFSFSPGCDPEPNLTLENKALDKSGVYIEVPNILTLNGETKVLPTEDKKQIIVRAGEKIIFQPGFKAASGSYFRATTDYNLNCNKGANLIKAYRN